MAAVEGWFNGTSIFVHGVLLLLGMAAAAWLGRLARGARLRKAERLGLKVDESQDAYVVSAVLGLLALLLGFTFSLAVDRYETRLGLVLQEANAIGTAYLRAQLLDEPHRSRLSGILTDYTDNRVALGTAQPEPDNPLREINDRLLVDLWSATAAAFDSVRSTDFSTALLESVNQVVDMDASRKAARRVRVPTEVFLVLVVYTVVTAGILGHVLSASRNAASAGVLFVLLAISLLLIIDIDRPAIGGIRENQTPMIELRDTLRAQPPGTFDRWR